MFCKFEMSSFLVSFSVDDISRHSLPIPGAQSLVAPMTFDTINSNRSIATNTGGPNLFQQELLLTLLNA